MAPPDSIAGLNDLPFASAADATFQAAPSDIERQVLNLFEQFRNPLLRYALSLGIPVHDLDCGL